MALLQRSSFITMMKLCGLMKRDANLDPALWTWTAPYTRMVARASLLLLLLASSFSSIVSPSDARLCEGTEHTDGRWVNFTTPPKRKSFHCCQYDSYDFMHDPVACRNPLWTEKLGFYDTQLVTGFNEYPTFVGEHSCNCDKAQGTRDTVSQRELYYWKPTNCSLLSWNATRFCEILGPRRMLFVGDSTQVQTFATLTNMIQSGNASCNSQITFGRSNLLVYGLKGGKNLHEWVQISNLPDIVVIACAAHLHDLGDMQFVLQHLAPMMQRIRDLYQEKGRSVSFAWKTSNPPHFNCTVLHEPLAEAAPLSPQDLKSDNYEWHLFPDFDAMAVNASKTLNMTILDVTPLRLRPDAHTGVTWKSDCLHYCLPGPIDLFSQVVMQALYNREL